MKRNIWPYAIIGYFVVFIGGIVGWVSFAMRHDDQLVRTDYYEHEIKYQSQIERVARTSALGPGANITYDASRGVIRVAIPVSERDSRIEGNVHLYRPSNSRLDERIPLSLGIDGTQMIDVSKLESGVWKVFLNWKALDQEYYLEKPVVVYK